MKLNQSNKFLIQSVSLKQIKTLFDDTVCTLVHIHIYVPATIQGKVIFMVAELFLENRRRRKRGGEVRGEWMGGVGGRDLISFPSSY